ncbi:MAG: MarR family winged helix-turn-helix transcriptional regulator [Gemmatimonadales bacterium]
MFSLLHAMQSVEARLESAFSEVGLSLARYGVLNELVRAGSPLALSQLAAQLSCVKSNMTQLIDRLEADGLVRRETDPADRRSTRAVITSAGLARHAEGADRLRQVEAGFDATIPASEREVLLRVLKAL